MKSIGDEIIGELRCDWQIQSVTPHTDGYWDYEAASFDLRHLKTTEELTKKDTGAMYITAKDDQVLLCIAGNESYYQVELVDLGELRLSCYFKNQMMDKHIKLATFDLRKK